MNEPQIRASIDEHEERSRFTFDAIRDARLPVDRVATIEHYFWARTQDEAAQLGRALYEAGYLVVLIAPGQEPSELWSVHGTFRRSCLAAASREVTEQLVRLAARFDADYDGWGFTS